ncbi:MAG: membrane protein insertion efficiency factor YidD [Desulfobacterales bacterium]
MRWDHLWRNFSKVFTDMLVKGCKISKFIVLALIRGYQLIVSPVLGPACRFYPSCSQYASLAINRYGVVKGSYLAFRRLLRCHPFHPGGFDPVP